MWEIMQVVFDSRIPCRSPTICFKLHAGTSTAKVSCHSDKAAKKELCFNSFRHRRKSVCCWILEKQHTGLTTICYVDFANDKSKHYSTARLLLPVRAKIYFSLKCCDVVDMLNSLQPQLFNFWTSQKVCHNNFNMINMILIIARFSFHCNNN